jgi:uncharacterized protein YggE
MTGPVKEVPMRCLMPLLLILAAPALAAESRTVVVSGAGEVMAVPDVAVLRFAVEARAPGVEEARRRVDEVVSGVDRLLADMQIPPEHVNTAALVVQPDYEWQQDTRQQKLLGYVVTRRMTVRLTDLGNLGTAFEGLLARGVNRIEPPSLDTSERGALELRALGDAARDARRRAEALAQALGARVGGIRHLEEGAGPDRYAATEISLRAAASDEAPGYQPGQIRIMSRVTATFDLVTD